MKILRETPHDVVVVKPAGWVMELGNDPLGRSLLTRLQRLYPKKTVWLPHRLDKITRGIVLVALSKSAVRYYNNEIQCGLWEKYYLGRIQTPTEEDKRALLGVHHASLKEKDGRSILVKKGGQVSSLEILSVEKTVKRKGESHVLIRLFTGRHHQIRCMLEGLGYPLVGDPLYTGNCESRKPAPFYLEHIVLRFRDFLSGEIATAHFEEDPDREPVDGATAARIAELVSQAYKASSETR